MKRLALGALLILAIWSKPSEAQQTCFGSSCSSSGSGTVTITSGSTDTSGCIAGGVLRSISNKVECGAGISYSSGALSVGTASTTTGSLVLAHASHAFTTTFQDSASQGAGITYTLPTTDGNASDFLQSNGSGVLTWAPGSSTITADTTSTSGCTDGGFLYSLTSLLRCGTVLTTNGTDVTAAGKINATRFAFSATEYISSTSSLLQLVAGNGNVQVVGGSNLYMGSDTNGTVGNAVALRGYNGSAWSSGLSVANTASGALAVTAPSGMTIGSSSLGTSVVPLTVTPGTGSTANLLNLTNSAGTTLSYVSSAGRIYANGIYVGLGATANDTGIYAPNGAGINADAASGDTLFSGYGSLHKMLFDYSEASSSALNPAFRFTIAQGANSTDGYGVGFSAFGKSGNGTERDMGLWGLQWATAADATRTSKFVVQTVNSAAARATSWETQNGHAQTVGTAPTVSSCGTSPSTVTGSDGNGRLTTGSGGTVQSCTLTFAIAYAAAPACVANNETSILLVRATATTTTLVIDSAVAGTLASQALTYICRGN